MNERSGRLFIDDLKFAIEDEYKAHHFYKSMLPLTTDATWQKFIATAMEDEKSHYEMLQQLYYMLTGQYVQIQIEKPVCHNLKTCLKSAIEDELDAAKKYKVMYLTVPIESGRIPFFIAMHDEVEHAVRFSTMYNAL